MTVSAELVKELRDKTGAGMMDCKKALAEASGSLDDAVKVLRTQGLARAKEKSGRQASEGSIAAYIHAGGKMGALVEVNCETDFVARTDDFKKLLDELALQVVANNPRYVSREQVPEAVAAEEKEIAMETARKEGKPDNILEKIAAGRMEKFYGEVCLLEQAYVREPEKRIQDVMDAALAKLGENIVIRRFSRFQLGEGQD